MNNPFIKSSAYRPQRDDDDMGMDLVVFHGKDNKLVRDLQQEVMDFMAPLYPDKEALKQAYRDKGLPIIEGGPVFQMKLALKVVSAHEGIVMPTLKRYDELVDTLHKFYPETRGLNLRRGVLIILSRPFDDYAYLAYQLYHWECYLKGLEGYSHEATQIYKTFSYKHKCQIESGFIQKLDYDEMYQLKCAVRRDREALQFLDKIIHEVIIPKNNARHFIDGQANA